MKIINIFIFLSLSSMIYSYNIEKSYISPNFETSSSAFTLGMQGTDIAINNISSITTNPALFGGLKNYYVDFSTNKLQGGLFNSDKLTFALQKDSISTLGFSFGWIDYGSWYDTRYLEKDAIIKDDGTVVNDTVGYWNDEKVIKRSANNFSMECIYSKRVDKNYSFAGKINAIYQNNEVSSNFGTSMDLSGLYKNGNVLLTAIIKNIGGGVIGNFSSKEADYQYMYLKVGISYRKIIRGDLGSYLDLVLTHNGLFMDNSNVVAGASLKIKSVFEIFGSYSLQSIFDSSNYFDYKKYGFGLGLNFKYLSIKYSQVIDNYNSISSNLSFSSNF